VDVAAYSVRDGMCIATPWQGGSMNKRYEKPELQRFGKFRDVTKTDPVQEWCLANPGHPRWIQEGCSRTS
jgi:hypothetical protein